MWVEKWSEKHQRPYFQKNKKTVWKGHKTIGQLYDALVSTRTGRLETALLSVREHNRFVKGGVMYWAKIVAAGQWHQVQQLRAFGRSADDLAIHHPPALKVLDVGCGDGTDLRRWTFDDAERWVTHVHGFDVSTKSISAAKKNKAFWKTIMGFPQDVEIQYKAHDARKTEAWADVFGQASPYCTYDVISCMHCLPYFFSSQKVAKAFFQRAADACRVGGALVAMYPSEEELAAHMWSVGRDRRYIELPAWFDLTSQSPPPKNAGARPPLPYTLGLPGAVPSEAVEYTVPKAGLLQVLRAAGWKVLVHESAQAFATRHHTWQVPFTDAYVTSKVNNVLICVKR